MCVALLFPLTSEAQLQHPLQSQHDKSGGESGLFVFKHLIKSQKSLCRQSGDMSFPALKSSNSEEQVEMRLI